MDRKPKQQESHSPPPDSITVKPKAQEELISLAHGGDAILIIPSNSPSSAVEKRYLVSIAILSQASRRFRELFAGSNSTFSLEKCADGVVQCKFPASDVKAAEAILSKLHYQDVAIHDPKTPQELEAVMRQAGAFTCTTAIRPWMRDWVSQIPTATNLSDQKALIMSAHYSQDPKLVDAMMARAAWGATKAEWERFEDKAKEKMPPHRLRMPLPAPPSPLAILNMPSRG